MKKPCSCCALLPFLLTVSSITVAGSSQIEIATSVLFQERASLIFKHRPGQCLPVRTVQDSASLAEAMSHIPPGCPIILLPNTYELDDYFKGDVPVRHHLKPETTDNSIGSGDSAGSYWTRVHLSPVFSAPSSSPFSLFYSGSTSSPPISAPQVVLSGARLVIEKEGQIAPDIGIIPPDSYLPTGCLESGVLSTYNTSHEVVYPIFTASQICDARHGEITRIPEIADSFAYAGANPRQAPPKAKSEKKKRREERVQERKMEKKTHKEQYTAQESSGAMASSGASGNDKGDDDDDDDERRSKRAFERFHSFICSLRAFIGIKYEKNKNQMTKEDKIKVDRWLRMSGAKEEFEKNWKKFKTEITGSPRVLLTKVSLQTGGEYELEFVDHILEALSL